jgi:hypothetical protein
VLKLCRMISERTNLFHYWLLASLPVLVCAWLIFARPAFAQDGIGVRVQPSTLDERADPGETISGVLTVTNQEGGRQTYYIATRNIDDMDESGRPEFSKDDPTDPMRAASWIKLDTTSITLDQGLSAEVPYHIVVPSEASPGSYFAAIFVTREAVNPTESGAGVGFQVASLLNLRVNGTALESVLFRELSTQKTFYTEPNVTFTARLENTGTVHERPRGVITISNMFGRRVGQLILNENAGGIMPRNDRVYETTWSTDAFTLGRYTASASVVFGDTDKQTITRDVTFWVVPLKEVGYVVGGVLLAALVLTLLMRAYVRRALTRAGHTSASSREERTERSFMQRLVRTIVWLVVLLALLFIVLLAFYA